MSHARSCDDFAKTFPSSYNNGNSIIGHSLNSIGTISSNFNFDSNDLPYCRIIAIDEDCSNLVFSDGVYIFVDKNNNFINQYNSISGINSCTFDVYGINYGTYLPKNSLGSSGVYGSNLSNAEQCSDFVSEFHTILNNSSIANAIFNFDPNGMPYCKFFVSSSCDLLEFSNGYHVFLDSDNNFINRYNNLSNEEVSTNGVTFSCGSENDINYDYRGFDVELVNSCFDQDQSFLVFTPKSNTIGTHSLGASENNNGSENKGLNVMNVNNQNGQFYLEPFCSITNDSKDILISVLNDIVIG